MPQSEALLSLLKEKTSQMIHQGVAEKIEEDYFIDSFLKEHGYSTNLREKPFLQKWIDDVWRLSFIKTYLNESTLEEIHLHSESHAQFVYKDQRKEQKLQLHKKDYQLSLEWLSLKHHQSWNSKKPCVSFTSRFGPFVIRYTLLHFSITPNKTSKLFIRKLTKKPLKLKDFSLTTGQESHILSLLHHKKNIMISGATASGKTTFLNSLLENLPSYEHIIILEDSFELQGRSLNSTHLLANQENLQESLLSFCHYALRLSPDRLILGETRGPEIIPLILSMNTGHKGFLSSLHANNAVDAISRMAMLFQVFAGKNNISYVDLIKMICQGIDYIIHLDNKKVVEVIQILGSEGITPYYKSFD